MVNAGKFLVMLLSVLTVTSVGCSPESGEEEPLPPVPADEAVTQRIAEVLLSPASEESVLALQSEISRLIPTTRDPQEAEHVVRSSLLAAMGAPSDIDALFALQQQAAGRVFSTRFSRTLNGAGTLALCGETEAETVVYFINGINTTLPEALTRLHALEASTRGALASTGTVDYRLLYNPTGPLGGEDSLSAACHDFGFLASFGRVSEAEKARLHELAQARCHERGWLEDTQEAIAQMQAAASSFSPQDWLTVRFRDVVRNDVRSGKRVIVVAHSQGNFYTRSMLDRLKYQPVPGDGSLGPSIGVISLGSPASFPAELASYVGGLEVVQVQYDWITLLPDAPMWTIANRFSEAVRGALARASVSAAWVALESLLGGPVAARDLLPVILELVEAALHSYRAHDLSESYLADPVIETVRGSMAAVASRLVNSREHAGQGFLQVALTWDRAGDIDLYVREPAGQLVYYRARLGQDGELDRDDTTGTGPENYYICVPSAVSEGEYRISVNNYRGVLGTRANISVRAGSKFDQFEQIMDGPNGGTHLIPVATIGYQGGSFSIARAP